jgi:two-component system, sensor histidine kinase and response regulator
MAIINVLQQKMKRRNLLATLLIAILVTVSFLSLMGLFKQQEKDAEIINIAGKQRMLSQKIALLAHQQYENLIDEHVDKNIQKHLIQTANTFNSNQHFLSELVVNESNTFPKEVSILYFNAPHYLNNKVNIYAKSAVELIQIQDVDRANRLMEKQFDREGVEKLLASLDSAVTKIEQHVKQRITSIYLLVVSL